MSQSWAVISGKGGVGRSVISAGLSACIGARIPECCCMDTVSGMRDLDLLLGLQSLAVYDAMDVVNGLCSPGDALLPDPEIPGMLLLPAPQSAGPLSREQLCLLAARLKKRCGYVFMDTPAGMGGLPAALAADRILLVTTADDVSLRDSERIISALRDAGAPAPYLAVNRVVPALVRSGRMYDPVTAARELDLPLLGYIPEDAAAGRRQRAFMHADTPMGRALERIAQRILGSRVPMPDPRGFRSRGLARKMETEEADAETW